MSNNQAPMDNTSSGEKGKLIISGFFLLYLNFETNHCLKNTHDDWFSSARSLSSTLCPSEASSSRINRILSFTSWGRLAASEKWKKSFQIRIKYYEWKKCTRVHLVFSIIFFYLWSCSVNSWQACSDVHIDVWLHYQVNSLSIIYYTAIL